MVQSIVKKKLALFAIVTAVVLIFFGSTLFQGEYWQLVGFFEKHVNEYKAVGVVVFVALAVLSTMFSFLSSIWLIPIAVPIFGAVLTTALLLSGWYIGAIFSYVIGRYAGYPIIARLVDAQKIDYYRDLLLKGRGELGLLLLVRFVLPSEIPGYVLGMARYHFGKYFLITVLSEIPYALAAVYAIDAITTQNVPMLVLVVGIWLLLASIPFYIFYLRIRRGRTYIGHVDNLL